MTLHIPEEEYWAKSDSFRFLLAYLRMNITRQRGEGGRWPEVGPGLPIPAPASRKPGGDWSSSTTGDSRVNYPTATYEQSRRGVT